MSHAPPNFLLFVAILAFGGAMIAVDFFKEKGFVSARRAPPQMRKPSFKVFTGCYVAIWLTAIVAAIASGGGPHLVIAINMVFILINLTGTAVCMATGWAPWRD